MGKKSLKLKPEGKRLWVQLNPVEERVTKGGVILPAAHSEESRTGTIIAVGDMVDKKYKPGGKILVAIFSGTVLHFPHLGITDDTNRMITQSEIMGSIEE